MSVDAMNWAYSTQVSKSSHKAVLVALAHCHHSKTGSCHPSVMTLSGMTSLNRKTVLSAIQWLKTSGLISYEKRNGAGNNYTLNTDLTSPKNGTASAGQKPVPKTDQSQKRTSPKNGTSPVPKTGPDQSQKRDTIGNRERKGNKYKGLNMAEVPENILVEIREFIDHRCNLKKPLTQNALARLITTTKNAAVELGWPESQVLLETIDAGWQGVNANWLRNRNGGNHAQNRPGGNPAAPKLTPAQRTEAKRQEALRRESAGQPPVVGIVEAHGGNVRPYLGKSAG